MKIQLGTLELARGLAVRESPRRFVLETSREIELATALRAPAARALDRGNARTTVRFTVARRHDTPEAALRFACTHPAEFNGAAGYLTFVIEDAPTPAQFHLLDAAARSVRCSPLNLITETEYEFAGGALTDEPPSP